MTRLRLDWRDVLLGAFLVAVAAGALYATRTLSVGHAADMGPGYMPRVVSLALLGFGLFFLQRGAAEGRQSQTIAEQRTILDMVKTQGKVSIADLSFATQLNRDQIEQRIRELVGRGLFTGYVDWNSGMLYSVDAAKLHGATTCPNCGGELTLAGKGLVKCPYCGAEIFL